MRKSVSVCLIASAVLLPMVLAMISIPVAAVDTTWRTLNPSGVYANDFHKYPEDLSTTDVLSNRTLATGTDTSGSYLDASPGFLYLRAYDDIDPDADFFTNHLELRLSNPTTVFDWYELRIQARMIVYDYYTGAVITNDANVDFSQSQCGFSTGLQYYNDGSWITSWWPTDLSFGEMADTSGSGWIPSAQGILDYSGICAGGYRYFNHLGNPAESRPWSYQEVCDMNLHIWFYLDDFIFYVIGYYQEPLTIALTQFYVEYREADYSEEPLPEGSFILRPSYAYQTDYWLEGDTDTDVDLWSYIDETTRLSDKETSFIYQNAIYDSDWLALNFTDPPSWAANTEYILYPWIINMVSELDYYADMDRVINVYLREWGQEPEHRYAPYAFTYWWNYTFISFVNPETGLNWTLAELSNIRMDIANGISGSTYLNISQIAILCVPSSDAQIDWPIEESAGSVILAWLSTGGIPTLFGVMGFFGMVATPTMTYLKFREDAQDGLVTIASGIFLFALFFGLFLVGIFAGSA